ncbi:MAG: GNAT family N-acetyltransferase [Acidimicrobiia bacterium]|jgi:acetyl coenzyme A synthetase (ADP forming)-like protein
MAEYPAEYQLDVVLRDGAGARVRPIKPDDGHHIRDFFERLGPESRYYRFFRVKNTLEPEEIEYFTHVDYADRMALIALEEGEMVGVGRYDRDRSDPTVAEVAFAVADDQQGRGLGTMLLELLTSYARTHGIEGFRAFVLGENRQMMRVFRNSGYELNRTLDSGVYTVDFPVEESESSLAAEADREKRAVAASVLPLFFPRSIAVIGASNDAASIGGRLFANVLAGGFTGPVYPVNPNAKVVRSVRAYPTVGDIPDEIDLAFIVVPQRFVVDVVSECAAADVRGIVVISAGFSEVGGQGVEDEARLLEIVRESGMRMVGPNCMGLLNTSSAVRLNGTFAPVYPPAGNVAMSSQSGALGIAILDYARQSNIGISQFVSVGNKADVSGNDLIMAWEDDPQTDVITLYLESFGNPAKFSRLARRVGVRKPIIAVKSGRSAAGSRAASSHTGALASSDEAVTALFRQAGVIRVDTIEELFDVASLLANQPIPAGRRVGIVTNAGGPGILAADALEAYGLTIPELSTELQQAISEGLAAEASTKNPIDLIASGGPAEFEQATTHLLNSLEVDSVMVIYVPTSPEGASDIAAALRRCQDDYEGDVPLLSVFMQSESAAASLMGSEGRRSIPTYTFPEDAAHALARASRHGEWRLRDPGVAAELPETAEARIREIVEGALERLGPEGGWLEAEEVEGCLQASGLRTPATRVARNLDEAKSAAAAIGGPVALKVISDEALHKSDIGGVALGLEGETDIADGYQSVTSVVSSHEGVLVQEYVAEGHEVLIGVAQDPNFGPMVVFGLGGVYVELLKDVSFRLHPITDVDASEMIRETRSHKLLEGYRNTPAGDMSALESALQSISGLVSVVPEIVEMDLNPVKVMAPGNGVCVVDARMRIASVPPSRLPSMRDLPGVTSNPPRS